MKKYMISSVFATSLLLSGQGMLNMDRNNVSNFRAQEMTKLLQSCNPNNISAPTSVLTDEAREAIQFMINEEKLAYDVYMDLYTYHNDGRISQLKNIAEKAETRHIQLVADLAAKYGIEETAPALENGEYTNSDIKALYDTLYEVGIEGTTEALQVGCMVEVVDINDLNEKIEIAADSNAQDVLDVFGVLRDGSYRHYWAFDKGLKNSGVSEGCCSLGDTYCHPEYPQNQRGQGGKGKGAGKKQGQGNSSGYRQNR